MTGAQGSLKRVPTCITTDLLLLKLISTSRAKEEHTSNIICPNFNAAVVATTVDSTICLKNVHEKYFTFMSLKEIFKYVSATEILDFIKCHFILVNFSMKLLLVYQDGSQPSCHMLGCKMF